MLCIVEDGNAPDPRFTRALLERQPGVISATVWVGGSGRFLSKVVVTDDSFLEGYDLQKLCLKELGVELTPIMIVIEHIRHDSHTKAA